MLCIECNKEDREGNYVDEITAQNIEMMASNFISKMGLEKASKKFDMVPLQFADVNTEDSNYEEEQIQKKIQDQDLRHNLERSRMLQSSDPIDKNREYAPRLPHIRYYDYTRRLLPTVYNGYGPRLPPTGYYGYGLRL